MKGRDETTPTKPQTATFENPNDEAALNEIKAAEAAGDDPFGDLDDDAPAKEPTPAASEPQPGDDDGDDNEGAAADATPAGAEAATPAAESAAAPEPAAAEPAPAAAAEPLRFNTKSPAELKAAQEALLDEQDAAFEKYSDGTLSAKEFSAIQRKVTLELGELTAQHALQQASQQTVEQAQQSAIAALKTRAKPVLDYDADPEAVDEFNRSAEMLAANPKNAGLTPAQLFDKAHDLVLHMRGIAPAAPIAAAATGKPPARQDMAGPITLRTLPAAATPNTTGGVNEELSRLNGLDFEERIGQMSKTQRDAYLDS